jgi:PAS domain S-box-containing protein
LLSLAALIAFAVASVEGVVEPVDLQRWMVLAAIGAFALSFTALKDHHRSQAILIDALLDKEERLAKSETMLRTLFDAVPDIMTLTRFSDGKLFEVNEEFLKRTGLDRKAALATSVVQLDAWTDPEERDRYIAQLMKEGRVRDLAVDFLLRGVVAPYLMSAVVVEIDGEAHALNVARDATRIRENERALREAQQRLRAQVDELTATQARLRSEIAEREAAERIARDSEATLRKVFEASHDIITVSSRSDFRLIQANSIFFRETGYSPAEVLGQQIYPKFWANPAQRELVKQSLDRDGFAHNVEADLLMKDGTMNSYLLSAVALELGGEPCRVSSWRNVTESKRAAQRIVQSEAMLRSMFDATPDIIITRRVDGPILDVNDEFVRRTGISREQAVGNSMNDIALFLRPEDRMEFLRRIETDGMIRDFETDYLLKGETVPYLVSGARVETGVGPLVFGISREIASRKQMD